MIQNGILNFCARKASQSFTEFDRHDSLAKEGNESDAQEIAARPEEVICR